MSELKYSLHARPSKRSKTGHVFYAQFKLASGKWSNAKSTGCDTETAAIRWAKEYLASGQVVSRENVTFGHFAEDFFNPEGDYAKHKKRRGKNVSNRQLHEQSLHLKNHVLPYFKNYKLTRIDYEIIDNFQQAKLDDGLAGDTVNKLTGILRAILETAMRKKLIQAMPLIERVGNRPKQRGILSVEEVQKLLLETEWSDFRAYVANTTAAFTGLRQGEIIALQRQDIRERHIHVCHSFNETWGLKETKTGRVRNVAMIPFLKAQIDELLRQNPYTHDEAFVFYSHRPDRPMEGRTATEALYEAMGQPIEEPPEGEKPKPLISEEERKARRVDFHSWRHFFNSMLINNGIASEKVRSLTGHTTSAMTERYFHADEFDDVVDVLGTVVTTDGVKALPIKEGTK